MNTQAALNFDFNKPEEKTSSAMSLINASNGQQFTDSIFKKITVSDVSYVESLLEEHAALTKKIIETTAHLKDINNSAMYYLVEGNIAKDRRAAVHGLTSSLTSATKAIAALDAEYWSKAINLTDVYHSMPANRKKEWTDQITDHTTPAFKEETVIQTLVSLLSSRTGFFCERIDNVFKSLSPEHLTNNPAAFTARFILKGVLIHTKNSNCEYWDISYDQSNIIDDLRVITSQIAGRASLEKQHLNTYQLLNKIESLRLFGQWHEMDGGVIRFKMFKVGTLHIEIHPDIAASMNNILSTLYPMSIPERFKNKPTKACKTWPTPVENNISLEALSLLDDMYFHWKGEDIAFIRGDENAPAYQEALEVLAFLGGRPVESRRNSFTFDYDIKKVIDYLVVTGKLPDKKSHQFYATTEELSIEAAQYLTITDNGEYFEPSAGQAGLAKHLPKNSQLIEISPIQCEILKSKGFTNVHCGDFLSWAKSATKKGITFDGGLANPPFCNNQAKAHIEAASSLLKVDGQLIAIAPATLKHLTINGFSTEVLKTKQVQFEGALVHVVILSITRDM